MAYHKQLLSRPFGEECRAYILDRHFSGAGPVSASNAWEHVYRLLLWVDPTTALTHCYESDKSQPGRHWYSRSLAFHQFVSERLGVAPKDLHKEVDFMFRVATSIMAEAMVPEMERRAKRSPAQRAPYPGLPTPGEGSEVASGVEGALLRHYGRAPPPELVSELVSMVYKAVSRENRRKNLLGEGFEDTLAEVVRLVGAEGKVELHRRKFLHELPGFREPAKKEKDRRVDLCLVDKVTRRRTLASVKWSVRADREEQFGADYDFYRRHEVWGEGFDFVLITNELDAARLVAACTRRIDGIQVFKRVVHIQPDGLDVVHAEPGGRSKANQLPELRESGRLSSLKDFLDDITR